MTENKKVKVAKDKKVANKKVSKSFIEQFLDELVKQAGFSPDEWTLIKEDLRPILQERIMLYIYKELDEKQIDQVWKYFEQEKYDELTEFLKKTIPNFDDFISEILAQFEDEYLENFKE